MQYVLKFDSTKHASSLCRPRPNICPKQTNYCPWSEVELLVQISKLTLETSLLCPFYWGSYQRGPGYKFWVSMSISILCHRNQPFETNQNTLTTRTVKINLQPTLVILVVDHLDTGPQIPNYGAASHCVAGVLTAFTVFEASGNVAEDLMVFPHWHSYNKSCSIVLWNRIKNSWVWQGIQLELHPLMVPHHHCHNRQCHQYHHSWHPPPAIKFIF